MNENIIRLQNVHKVYRQGQVNVSVLRNFNLDVQFGETLAIVGPSGSGKSTLLSLIAGLDKPTSGTITVLGKDLGALDEEALTLLRRHNFGIVFQQFNLFPHLTALENVALPLELADDPEALAKAQALLERVGLKERLAHFPHQMSGGENQRVAIARALVVKPKLLLADEPSGSLDHQTGEQVSDLLFELVRDMGTTLVLVTHNHELAQKCQRRYEFAL